MNAVKRTARLAGLLYLIVIVAGVFAEFFVRSRLIVPGDAAATADNIMGSPWLFRIGFVSDLVAHTSYLLLALVLYTLLKSVNATLAKLFLLLASTGVAVLIANMLNHFAAVLLLSGANYLTAFDAGQLHALALFFLNMHDHGYTMAAIFYGGWLLPLGFVVFASGYFPKILGILLMIAPLGYLIELLATFLFPSFEAITYPGLALAAIAEGSFGLWLLLRGARMPEIKSS